MSVFRNRSAFIVILIGFFYDILNMKSVTLVDAPSIHESTAMGTTNEMRVGVIGAVGRGGSFSAGFKACGARIHAVCDTNTERLE